MNEIKVTEVLEIKTYGRIPTGRWTYHVTKTEKSGWYKYANGYKLYDEHGSEIFIPIEKIIEISKLYYIEKEE